MTLLIVIAVIAAFLAYDGIRIYIRKRKSVVQDVPEFKPFRSVEMPLGIFLDRSHLWVRLNDSGEFRIGLDELVLQAVRDIDRLELAPSGTRVRKGDQIGTLHAGGRAFSLKSPVSGTVISENDAATSSARTLYEDPYFSGWLIKVWPTDPKESIKTMMIGEAAKKWMQREIQRFADFLSMRATPAIGHAMADGAKPVSGALLSLDERGWNDFQGEFLDAREP